MKNVRRLFGLTVMLLMAIAVPLAERGVNAAPRQPAVTMPHVVADSLPVPWCKAGPPHCIGVISPQAVADSLPVPWAKSQAVRVLVAPPVSGGFAACAVGKKPGGTQS